MCHLNRVGQNQIFTVYIRYFWQGHHQIYGQIRCIYTVLANTTCKEWHTILQWQRVSRNHVLLSRFRQRTDLQRHAHLCQGFSFSGVQARAPVSAILFLRGAGTRTLASGIMFLRGAGTHTCVRDCFSGVQAHAPVSGILFLRGAGTRTCVRDSVSQRCRHAHTCVRKFCALDLISFGGLMRTH